LRQIVQADRSNCMLNTEKLRGLGIELRPVREAMQDVMRRLKRRRNEGGI